MTSHDGADATSSEPSGRAKTSVGRNIAANFVGRAYALGATYFFVPFYIKILGVEAYGLIAFYAVLLAVSAVADVGLSATFSREAAARGNSAKLTDLLGTTERILFGGIAVVALGVIASASWLAENWFQSSSQLPPKEMVGPLRLMAALLVPQMLFTLYSAGLLGLQRQVAANVLQAVLITFRAGLVTLLILWRPELNVFFAWQAIVTLVLAVVARAVLLRAIDQKPTASLRFSLTSVRPHLGYAGGMVVITAISTINTQLDKILISRMFSIADFGYYSIASTLAQLPYAVALPIGVAFFPKLVAHVSERDAGLAATYRQYTQLVAFVGALMSFGLAIFAPEILRIWLDSPVPPILPPLVATLAIGTFLLCLNAPPYYLCLARGRSWTVVVVSLATLILSVPILLAGLHYFGMGGGALAWVLLNLISLVLLVVTVEFADQGSFAKIMIRATAGSACIAGVALMAGRWLATGANLGPFGTITLAVVCTLCAIAVFAVLVSGPRSRPFHQIARLRAALNRR